MLRRAAKQDFYNVSKLDFRGLLADPEHIAQSLRLYIDAFSPGAVEVLDKYGFDTQITRLDEAGLLYQVVARFADIDLHPDRVSNVEMGYVFEELIRKFSEAGNETAGEHFTPREVIRLMVNLLLADESDTLAIPGIVKTLYDPACGTGGMLSTAEEWVRSHNDAASLELFGQELNGETYAICRSDMMLKAHTAANIASATPSLTTLTRARPSTTCSPIRPSAWSGRRSERLLRPSPPVVTRDASAPAPRGSTTGHCCSCST